MVDEKPRDICRMGSNAARNIEITDRSSQDVFLVQKENGKVELVDSVHVGHQYFQSLAELNRTKFMASLNRNENGIVAKGIALSLVKSIQNKGKGKILLATRKSDSRQATLNDSSDSTTALPKEDFKEIGSGEEAKMMIFKTMMQMFAVGERGTQNDDCQDKNLTTSHERKRPATKDMSLQSERPDSSPTSAYKRPRLFSEPDVEISMPKDPSVVVQPSAMLDSLYLGRPAAQLGLLGHRHGIRESQEMSRFTNCMTPTEPVKAASAAATGIVFGAAPATAAMAIPTAPNTSLPQQREGLSAIQTTSGANTASATLRGVSFTALRQFDVLCGGDGTGVLKIAHPGNRVVQDLVDFHLQHIVAEASAAQRLRIAQEIVALVPLQQPTSPGRFMAANGRTGLWYEVGEREAVSRVLVTLQNRLNEHYLVPTMILRPQGGTELMALQNPLHDHRILPTATILGQQRDALVYPSTLSLQESNALAQQQREILQSSLVMGGATAASMAPPSIRSATTSAGTLHGRQRDHLQPVVSYAPQVLISSASPSLRRMHGAESLNLEIDQQRRQRDSPPGPDEGTKTYGV